MSEEYFYQQHRSLEPRFHHRKIKRLEIARFRERELNLINDRIPCRLVRQGISLYMNGSLLLIINYHERFCPRKLRGEAPKDFLQKLEKWGKDSKPYL